jgi:hypothetical protein
MVRLDEDKDIKEKIDTLYGLQQTMETKKAAYKKEIASLESRIKELSAEISGFAERKEKSRITGVSAIVEFTPSVSRVINPSKFLLFLKKFGKSSEFWKFAKVPLGEATKHYGEAVLESAGVLEVTSNKYGNMKVLQNTQ